MGLDLPSFSAAMKELYTDRAVKNTVYKDNPFLAMVPKMENFVGKNMPVPIIIGNPQNRSATFATAIAGSQTTNVKEFTITRVKDYSVAFLDNETIEAADGDKGSFLKAAQVEIDGALNALSRSLAVSLFRDSSGYIGQVNAEPAEAATTVITLKSASDATNFEVGQTIVVYSAKSGGSQRIYDTGVTTGVISLINRAGSSPTITINTAYTSSGTIAADDYLFVDGDRGAKVSGLEDWIPDSAPGATAFFGVDRSVDTVRLGGVRFDGSSLPIEEALIEGLAAVNREGGSPDVAIVNYKTFAELEKALGSKKEYCDIRIADADIGFRGMMIQGPKNPVKVVVDMNQRADRCHLLQMDTWQLASLGPAGRLFDKDGNVFSRQATADGVELRAYYYAQLSCNAPGWNGVVLL